MTAEVHLGDGAYSTIADPWFDGGVEWELRYGDPEMVRYVAASLLSTYQYMLSGNITTKEAIRRLRVLRRARGELAHD